MQSNQVFSSSNRAAALHVMGWAAICFVVLALAAAVCAAQTPNQTNALWRPYQWGNASGYELPAALQKPASQWPAQGWVRLTLKERAVQVTPVVARKNQLPEFLQLLITELYVLDDAPAPLRAYLDTVQAEALDSWYLHLGATQLKARLASMVQFPRGVLHPRIAQPYAMTLGGQTFSFSVHHGRRNKAGVAYGDGVRYEIAYGGQRYTYVLQGSPWDCVIQAIADVDGDGRPDFIVHTDRQSAVFLSSQAKPGKNAPTAVLDVAYGC